MALDWDSAQKGPDGQLTVSLEYGNVHFHCYPHGEGWVVDVSYNGIVRWSDDNRKEASQAAAKSRAEEVYADNAASWCCMDMLAELLKGST